MKCNICNNSKDNKTFQVREMMFGYRDIFIYFQCSKCGCLQISENQSDVIKHYPSNYYSFKNESWFTKTAKRLRLDYALFGKSVIGKLVYMKFPDESLRILSTIITKNSKILDVGCGCGSLLYSLREIGFKNLLGIDPYIENDIKYRNGLKIIKKEIYDIDTKWDTIMFHHSFEHIPDQLETLKQVSKLLSKDGTCLIRIPTVSSYAWEHYGVNWVQLDAPRHLYLHSIKSIETLAEESNLKLIKVIYDSTSFQFWGSEQYLSNIPLESTTSYKVNTLKSIFTKSQIKKFKQKAEELNLEGRGDQAAFILTRKENEANHK